MVRSKFLKIEKVGVSYFHFDKGDKFIVFLHGWGAQKEKLLPLGKSLAQEKWQVLIPDLPGFGKSDPPPKPWKVDDYALFINRFLKRIWGQKKIYFLGHSFGGRLALKVAASFPDQVAGVVLVDSAGISRANVFKRLLFLGLARIGKKIFPKSQIYRRLLYKLARAHDYEKTKGVIRETFKLVIGEDLKPILKKIKSPILILWGKKDRETKYTDDKIIKTEVRNSKLISFRGMGHRLPYEKPKLLAKKIDSWEKREK